MDKDLGLAPVPPAATVFWQAAAGAAAGYGVVLLASTLLRGPAATLSAASWQALAVLALAGALFAALSWCTWRLTRRVARRCLGCCAPLLCPAAQAMLLLLAVATMLFGMGGGLGGQSGASGGLLGAMLFPGRLLSQAIKGA